MAKTAKRKRKPIVATGKVLDLLDIPPRKRAPTPSEQREFEKGLEQIARMWVEGLQCLEGPALELPDDWALTTPPARRLSGKKWVPIAYARKPNELLAMTITDASHVLAEQSETASDCAKPLKARYIEKLLRELGSFPLAHRNPLKQRPK
jgi:hypothetical protein